MAESEKKVKDVKDTSKAKKAKGPNIFKRIAKYFRDLTSETKKIVWPSKKQTKNNTLVVIAVVAVAALVIVSLDFAFGLTRDGLLGLIG